MTCYDDEIEEKRKLMERLAAKSGKSGSPTTESASATATDQEKNSQTDALKAQLAALEAEAKSLGIDPDQAEEPAWAGRGRGYRDRGTFVPRGSRGFDRGRGAFRGRGGAPFGGANPYKLDNRPKKIALTGVNFTEPEKDENLRQYLLGIGEFTELEATPTRTTVTFKDRFTAEKFMYGTSNGELPSIGKVEMTWVQTPLPPVDLSKLNNKPTVAQTEQSGGDETMADEGDAMSHAQVDEKMDNGGGGSVVRGQDRQELDYDVADDNDWGVQ